jgi:DnaJ-class molecular chaperone
LDNTIKYLKKISSVGNNSVDFLSTRVLYYEKSLKFNLAKKDYDSLYAKTTNVKYKLQSENMQLAERREFLQDSLRSNCKVCRGSGEYNIQTKCELCTNGIIESGDCRICVGYGDEICNTCKGKGKTIKKFYTTDPKGFTTSTLEQLPCDDCNSKGSFKCRTCQGSDVSRQTCKACNGSGVKSKRAICPMHK